MSKVSTAMVKPILEEMYGSRSEMVPCFIGAPGIGKTQGLYEFAKEKGVKVVTFILSNTVPSEVSGMRMPDSDTKLMAVFDDVRMSSLEDGDILFFDEFLEAPEMLWSACLTLIQDRIMASGRKLPDVFIVAASNQVASPKIIEASVRDRFQFIELRWDAYHWRSWFKDKYGVDPQPICPFIQEDSDQYNILTPRRVTKLYNWLKAGGDRKIKKQTIMAMFDAVVCEKLMDIVNMAKTPQQQIAEALKSRPSLTTCDFESMSLKEIMEFLQQQPEWGEMQKTLASIDFDEGEKEDIEY